jgi:CheY-like chemotaxis protein
MGLRILLADDEEPIRFVVAKHLERHGWTVEFADDGHEAVRRAAEGDYDALVLDQRMPGLTGLEVAEALDGAVPTILFSAVLDPDFEAEARRLGCAIVAKGEIDQLVTRLAGLEEGA